MSPKWTQDEAIAFECARECITDMIGICSSAIFAEKEKAFPDQDQIEKLEARMFELVGERRDLRLKDHDPIAKIRAEYGAYIRAYRNRSRVI